MTGTAAPTFQPFVQAASLVLRPGGLAVAVAMFLIAACGRPGPGPSTLRIYLARHGQTDWNAEHRLQGHADTGLNDLGREQAGRLLARMRGVRLDRIYSSTLRRSRETAEIVRGSTPLESLPGLCERDLGKFQGLRRDGSSPDLEAEYSRRSSDPDDRLEGGESIREHHARVQAAVASILSRHHQGAILIVGHGGTNQAVLASLLGLDLEAAGTIEQGNDELYLVEVAAGQPSRLWKGVSEGNLGDL